MYSHKVLSSKHSIKADTKDRKPLADAVGPFRVVVPDENKPARSAFEVTHLIIRFAKDSDASGFINSS
jgi:hypothetical protein